MNDKGKYWDETYNTVIGCTKCSPGCLNCWAFNLHMQRFRAYCQGKKVPEQYAKTFSEIQLLEHRLEMPLHWRNPRTIFVNNMGDTFHPAVEIGFLTHIFDTIEQCPQHKFLILTKRPEQALKMMWGEHDEGWRYFGDGDFHKNIWFGITICDQAEADEKIPILLRIPAAYRWLSIEPLLGRISLAHALTIREWYYKHRASPKYNIKGWFDWVVIGCESLPGGKAGRFQEGYDEAALSLIKQCQAAGVRVYHKQRPVNGRVSKNMSEWPEQLQVRETI